eukprot:g9565.t1
MLPTCINSLCQIWFHLGGFRSILYHADRQMIEEVARIQFRKAAPKNSHTSLQSSQSEAAFVENRVQGSLCSCLRDVFARLQHRQGLASAAKLASCVTFPKNDLECYVRTIFEQVLSELETGTSSSSTAPPHSNITTTTTSRNKELGPKALHSAKARATPEALEQELAKFVIEVAWTESPLSTKSQSSGGGWSGPISDRSPVFPLLIRGFTNLEECLDHYFMGKVLDDGDGGRSHVKRCIKTLPPVVFWTLTRGGVNERFDFPRVLHMGKYVDANAGYADADLEYALYAVMVVKRGGFD